MRNYFTYCAMLVLSILAFKASAQDTAKYYKHNINIHPILEGVSFRYEHPTSLSNSIKFGFLLRESDEFSGTNGLEGFKEQQLHFQYRKYFNAKKSNMNGLFHGAQIVAKKIEGKVTIFDFRRTELIDYKNKAIGLGYLLGYQKMTKSGFNFEFGYALNYNLAQLRSFKATFLDIVPYRPYNTGVYTQMFVGLGLAF